MVTWSYGMSVMELWLVFETGFGKGSSSPTPAWSVPGSFMGPFRMCLLNREASPHRSAPAFADPDASGPGPDQVQVPCDIHMLHVAHDQ